MSSLGVKGRTQSWEAHERDPQCGETGNTSMGISQRLRKEDNSKINKVSALKPDLAKIIEKVCVSRYSENSETKHHLAVDAS